MTKLKGYPEYKASGIEWIGDVPEGWICCRIGLGYEIVLGKMLQPKKQTEGDKLVPYLRALNVQWDGIVGEFKEMWADAREIMQYAVLSGDLLVCEGGEVGRATIFQKHIQDPVIIQNALHRVRAKNRFSVYFLFYMLRHITGIGYFSVLCDKSTIAHFTYEKFNALRCVFPSLPEQQSIADFLDRETAHIDAIITKKTRLIELLKEKRQATITHAVTKGLNPQATLKDSGIEWIGDVPEGWKIKPFRYFSLFRRGLPITKEDLRDTGIPTLNYGEIHSKYPFEVSPEKHFLKGVHQNFLKTHKMSLLKHGDFVFADTSEDLEGSGNFSYFNSTCIAFAGYHTIIVSLDFDSHERFFAYLFDSQFFRKQIVDKVRGIKVFSITQEILKSTSLLVPPLPEQQAIADYLDKQCAAIDAIITKTQRSIELLKEKRQALITAAVTGQIDVRS